jgi:hypothetical protein
MKTGAPAESAEELLQNMRLMNEFGYYFGASLDESHSVRAIVPILYENTVLTRLDLER